MKEASIEVAKTNIEFSRQGISRFRECAAMYPECDSFHSIYSNLASIYDGYQLSFELILLLEGEELPRPFSRSLEELIDKYQQKDERSAKKKRMIVHAR